MVSFNNGNDNNEVLLKNDANTFNMRMRFQNGVATGSADVLINNGWCGSRPGSVHAVRRMRGWRCAERGCVGLVVACRSYMLNHWGHVCFTLDATTKTARLYRDGVLLGSNTNAIMPTLTRNMWLGRSPWPNDARFNGQLSGFRVFNRPLSVSAGCWLV